MQKSYNVRYVLMGKGITIYCDKMERIKKNHKMIWLGDKGNNSLGHIKTGSLRHCKSYLDGNVIIKGYDII